MKLVYCDVSPTKNVSFQINQKMKLRSLKLRNTWLLSNLSCKRPGWTLMTLLNAFSETNTQAHTHTQKNIYLSIANILYQHRPEKKMAEGHEKLSSSRVIIAFYMLFICVLFPVLSWFSTNHRSTHIISRNIILRYSVLSQNNPVNNFCMFSLHCWCFTFIFPRVNVFMLWQINACSIE